MLRGTHHRKYHRSCSVWLRKRGKRCSPLGRGDLLLLLLLWYLLLYHILQLKLFPFCLPRCILVCHLYIVSYGKLYNSNVISGFRFSSERKCIGLPRLTSQVRDSVLFSRFSSHLCIGQNGFHVRIKFSMSNLTLELSLCFLSYRSRKSGCLCIPSCRFFFPFRPWMRLPLCATTV